MTFLGKVGVEVFEFSPLFEKHALLSFPLLDDRVNDYQHYALDAVQSCSQYPDMGAQVCWYILTCKHRYVVSILTWEHRYVVCILTCRALVSGW